MANMPQEMPVDKAPPQSGGGDATALVSSINSNLLELLNLMSGSPSVNDKDKAQLSQIQSMFQGFVEKNLGAAPGEEPAEEEMPEQGPVPMMAGSRKVMPAM